jgi:hypothetical protein
LQRPLSDNTQHSQETGIHAPGGIRTHDPSKRAATDPRLWDRRRSEEDLYQDFLSLGQDLKAGAPEYETDILNYTTTLFNGRWKEPAVCLKVAFSTFIGEMEFLRNRLQDIPWGYSSRVLNLVLKFRLKLCLCEILFCFKEMAK